MGAWKCGSAPRLYHISFYRKLHKKGEPSVNYFGIFLQGSTPHTPPCDPRPVLQWTRERTKGIKPELQFFCHFDRLCLDSRMSTVFHAVGTMRLGLLKASGLTAYLCQSEVAIQEGQRCGFGEGSRKQLPSARPPFTACRMSAGHCCECLPGGRQTGSGCRPGIRRRSGSCRSGA